MKCKCGETDPTKFYGHKTTSCGKCHNEYTVAKRKANKEYALSKLGGKCKVCGFDSFQEGLSFHHLDPTKKDSDFRNHLNWSRKRIDEELKDCVCLCLTCHAGVEAGRIALD